MLPRPFHSIGLLFHRRSGANLAFLGTCFAYRSRDVFVTAAHCFGNLKAADLEIVLPVVDHAAPAAVDKVVVHSSADIALLYVPTLGSAQSAPFFSTDAVLTWGSEVQALGYPEESEEDGVVPTARLFSGTIQRLFAHESRLGYAYDAGELSFGAPAGLSGGPVFWPRDLAVVVGVVAENKDSTTYLRSVEEVQEDGETYREKLHEVIRYGIYVRLDTVRDWLDMELGRLLEKGVVIRSA